MYHYKVCLRRHALYLRRRAENAIFHAIFQGEAGRPWQRTGGSPGKLPSQCKGWLEEIGPPRDPPRPGTVQDTTPFRPSLRVARIYEPSGDPLRHGSRSMVILGLLRPRIMEILRLFLVHFLPGQILKICTMSYDMVSRGGIPSIPPRME